MCPVHESAPFQELISHEPALTRRAAYGFSIVSIAFVWGPDNSSSEAGGESQSLAATTPSQSL